MGGGGVLPGVSIRSGDAGIMGYDMVVDWILVSRIIRVGCLIYQHCVLSCHFPNDFYHFLPHVFALHPFYYLHTCCISMGNMSNTFLGVIFSPLLCMIS